ncbi:MAG: carboxypeptidase regulatory-like domain-containing protein [Acidobacteria bacterium]|nr:carboxypeptidase regulatory-like domain-containing protein [Acidobacteriota bacterium]
MRLRRRGTSISLVSVLLLAGAAAAPVTAHAQDQAGITGRVVDETEAALPGVTVEARSPALIEQVRTVFTDSAGNYRFITLPPGAYSVTFTLPGFRRVVREGVVLTGAFVAPVDARLEVGGLEETVMVTGVAPLVDVVSNRQQTVLTTEEINTLPGSANVLTAMQYVPGVQGNWNSESLGAVIHGSDGPDSQPHVDGIKSGMQLGSRNSFVGGIGLLTDEGSGPPSTRTSARRPAPSPWTRTPPAPTTGSTPAASSGNWRTAGPSAGCGTAGATPASAGGTT